MEPILRDGAIVCIDRNDKRTDDKSIFAVRTEEGGVTVKRVQAADGEFLLLPAHPAQVVRPARGEDATDYIVGKVIWAWQSFEE